MKKSLKKKLALICAIACVLSISALAATSGTKNGIYAKISASSYSSTYEKVSLVVTRSGATSVYGQISVYDDDDYRVEYFSGHTAQGTELLFYELVDWDDIATGYYAKGSSSAVVNGSALTGYSPTVYLA